MTKVVDENELVKAYDFSSIITQSDADSACKQIQQIISTGNYYTNSPRYQTKENLFARQDPVWLKFRMSFLFAVFMYFGREVRVGNMQAWSFMTNTEGAEDRKSLWHHHQHIEYPQMMSGILYLHIPEDVNDRDTCGTEIAVGDPETSETFFVRPRDFTWFVYPSKLWHRPGIPQSRDYRFVLAADVECV